jgi:hypothetical protein
MGSEAGGGGLVVAGQCGELNLVILTITAATNKSCLCQKPIHVYKC